MPRKATKKGKFKLKTHKATAKRFRLTAGGKLLRTKGGKSHLRRRKSARTKAQFGRDGARPRQQDRQARPQAGPLPEPVQGHIHPPAAARSLPPRGSLDARNGCRLAAPAPRGSQEK